MKISNFIDCNRNHSLASFNSSNSRENRTKIFELFIWEIF